MAYLDHAATTPMRPEALETYIDCARHLGNASSLHRAGREARRRVEEARERLGAVLGAKPSEIVFTGSGTEANNLAIKGLHWARRESGRNRILSTSIEHHAVSDVVEWLRDHEQADVTTVGVDERAYIDVDSAVADIDNAPDEVTVVSTMSANNEVGTIQNLGPVIAAAGAHGIPVHADAVQAIGHVPMSFSDSGLTALSLSGHKLGGPTGCGVLLLKRATDITPLLHGGGQERDIRSSTLDVAGICALTKAADLAVTEQEAEERRLSALRDQLIERIQQIAPDAILNGDPVNRLPGNVHFSFPGCEGDALLMLLDAAGVECATGSACSAGVAQPSHVLLAMGRSEDTARSSLRFSLGWSTTQDDIDALAAALPDAVKRARSAGLS
ncbi:cysteine desulfurase family protein [Haloglycomyces albus]|uniref:cysteine desulfurase family protein n=1 Tax=Haloglycomyces albus TaxID=526067 RepID=UPI00046CCED0|nr:cysteine desulfurase family protein [Haloglycomyces albus]